MRRPEFITLIGTAASAAWPLAVYSQQPRMSRIGMLVGLAEDDPEAEKWIQALVEGLSQLDGSATRIYGSIYVGPLSISLECSN